ncbi:MAG: acyl-CoA/acyl-ACP dehydrogenase [Caldilineaceae bacterium]|nr:acyl-CoA/acyl-ACP dehydrogenase [Caldilineaceae bacterium]
MLYPRTERLQRFIDVARSLIPVLRERAAQHDRDGTFPHENFVDIRRVGLPALIVPQEFGGWGANLLESTLTMETLAQGDGSTALSFVMHVQVIGGVAEAFEDVASEYGGGGWPQPLFAQVCRDAVEQGALINSVATEPNLGSPSRGGLPETTAEPVRENGKDAWRINGLKTFASLSPEMDYFIIPAALRDGSGHVARFVIPAGPHFEIIETWDSFGMRATGSHDLKIVNARVTDEQMIGRGAPSPRTTGKAPANAWFICTVGAVYLGVAQAALDFAADYALKRVPTALGKPIAELESIQRRLGQAELLLLQARALLYNTARDWDQQETRRDELTPAVLATKFTVTNNAIEAVDHAVRVVGGASMSRSLPLERYLRDVRPGLFHPLNDDQALTIFGKNALKRTSAMARNQ